MGMIMRLGNCSATICLGTPPRALSPLSVSCHNARWKWVCYGSNLFCDNIHLRVCWRDFIFRLRTSIRGIR